MTSTWKVPAVLAAMLVASSVSGALALDCAFESTLNSAANGAPVELSFRNASGESRKLFWLDQDGKRSFIADIQPGSVLSQPTSESHSWVVTDSADQCLTAVTASSQPETVDVGGAGIVQAPQVTPPTAGTQQRIAQPAQPVQPQAAPQGASSIPANSLGAMAQGSVQDLQAQVPQVSPIEQFALRGSFRVMSVLQEGKILNVQASGRTEVIRVKPEWDSGQWTFEGVPGTPFVRIKSNWKKTYLVDDNSVLRSVPAPADLDESHWSFEPVDGTSFVQFRNRESNRFLLDLNNEPQLIEDFRQDQERQSYWQVNPAAAQMAVNAPRVAVYDSAIRECRAIGGIWTGSTCRSSYAALGAYDRPLACPRGWFWSPEFGECEYDGGAAMCPPWQQGPGGQCMSNLTCRGGNVRMSRRGASCDCPFGMAPWGNYPNLSCTPSVARIVPLILGVALGGQQTKTALGQVYGNKKFGNKNQTQVVNFNSGTQKVTLPKTPGGTVNALPTTLPTTLPNTLPTITTTTTTPTFPPGTNPIATTLPSGTVTTLPTQGNVVNTTPNVPPTITNNSQANTTTNVQSGANSSFAKDAPKNFRDMMMEAGQVVTLRNGTAADKAAAATFCQQNPNREGCKMAGYCLDSAAGKADPQCQMISPERIAATNQFNSATQAEKTKTIAACNNPSNNDAICLQLRAIVSDGPAANTAVNGVATPAAGGTTPINPAGSPAEKAVADFNKLAPQAKQHVLNACKTTLSPSCNAINVSAGVTPPAPPAPPPPDAAQIAAHFKTQSPQEQQRLLNLCKGRTDLNCTAINSAATGGSTTVNGVQPNTGNTNTGNTQQGFAALANKKWDDLTPQQQATFISLCTQNPAARECTASLRQRGLLTAKEEAEINSCTANPRGPGCDAILKKTTPTTTNPATTNPVAGGTKPLTDTENAVAAFNKMNPEEKKSLLSMCATSPAPNCTAIKNAAARTGGSPNAVANPVTGPARVSAPPVNTANPTVNPVVNPATTTTTNPTTTTTLPTSTSTTTVVAPPVNPALRPNPPPVVNNNAVSTTVVAPAVRSPTVAAPNNAAADATAKAQADAKAATDAKAAADAKARADAAAAQQKATADAAAKAQADAKAAADAKAKADAAAAQQKAQADAAAKAAQQKAQADAAAKAAAARAQIEAAAKAAQQKAQADAAAKAAQQKAQADAAARANAAAAAAKAQADAAAKAAQQKAQADAAAKAAAAARPVRQPDPGQARQPCPPGKRQTREGACV